MVNKMKYSHIYKIENQNRYKTANPYYYLFKTETDAYLFTESDILTAKERAEKNKDDIPNDFEKEKKGFFSRFFG
jgi:hypothetical protein